MTVINIQHCRDSKSTAELKKYIIIIIRSNVDNFYSCEVSMCVCVCIYTYGERVRGRVTRLVLPGEKLKGSCRSSCRRCTNPHSNYGYSQQQLAICSCRNKSSTIKCRFCRTTKIRWWVAGGSSQLARITVFFFFFCLLSSA